MAPGTKKGGTKIENPILSIPSSMLRTQADNDREDRSAMARAFREADQVHFEQARFSSRDRKPRVACKIAPFMGNMGIGERLEKHRRLKRSMHKRCDVALPKTTRALIRAREVILLIRGIIVVVLQLLDVPRGMWVRYAARW